MTQQDDRSAEEPKKLSVFFVTMLVIVGVLFTLLSLVGTLLSAPETWHRFARFVSDHTSFLSDQQVIYLRNGLLIAGSCVAGFALGRTRRDRKLSKWLTGTALVCIGLGIALTGAAAIEKLDPPTTKVGVADALVVVKPRREKQSPQEAVKSPVGDTAASLTAEPEPIEASPGSSSSSFQAGAKPSTASGCVCPSPPTFVPEGTTEATGGSSIEIVETGGSETESRSESESSSSSESVVESRSESESSSSSSSSSESSSEVILE